MCSLLHRGRSVRQRSENNDTIIQGNMHLLDYVIPLLINLLI